MWTFGRWLVLLALPASVVFLSPDTARAAAHSLLPGSSALNTSATAFTPPPEFDQPGAGFSRMFNGRVDMGTYEYEHYIYLPVILFMSQVSPSVVISTVMYQGIPALNMADQYVDLRNRGSTAVNIGGWTLTAVSTSKVVEFPYGLVMQPGQVCRVYTNAPVDYGNCGALSFYSPIPVWSTTQDVAELRDANNNIVDVYSYTQVPR
ncbi:MAG: lamin tail domain-containing protein [Chloroflexi bacterium]|nr:lamin tail domain-containing protein [Chloroflexota bacterium]